MRVRTVMSKSMVMYQVPEAFDYTRIICNKRKPLLHRDALGEIPWLIHIAFPRESRVISNEL